jgi:hypothetical protein
MIVLNVYERSMRMITGVVPMDAYIALELGLLLLTLLASGAGILGVATCRAAGESRGVTRRASHASAR